MPLRFLIFLLLSLGLQAQSLYPQPVRQLVQHSAYLLDYDEAREQAAWVFYELTREELSVAYERSDNFRSDPKVRTGSAGPRDYAGSGYDRGHLAPAADLAFSPQAMSESFYMSNMSPQEPGFNRGIWKKLEGQVRAWAYDDGEIYVISGPLYLEPRGTLPSGIAIPSHYFKVLLDDDPDGQRSMAFILPNQKSRASLRSFAVSIDRVEELSGLDFFSSLPDALEESLEAQNQGYWNYALRLKSTSSKAQSDVHNQSSSAVQCSALTQKGSRCKRRTKNRNGRCWQHQ